MTDRKGPPDEDFFSNKEELSIIVSITPGRDFN
jgi:hypothetical protein